MKRFEGIDLYNSDSLFTEEELMVRDTIRGFVDQEVMPIISEHYREGTFPRQMVKRFAEMNMLGMNLKGYGCAGMNNVAYGLAMQELERGDGGFRSFVSVQSSLSMYPIYEFGSDQQKENFLPKMAAGEWIGCFGLTEPDFGSNPGGMATTAKKKGGKWILNGTKRWITNATIANVLICWAKDENGVVQGFILERGMKGLIQNEIKGKLSLRASDTGEFIMEDVEVPEENRLPKTQGLKAPLMCLSAARYGIAWGGVGSAMATFCEALDYAKSRIQFDRPIASFQLVQEKLVWMANEITKGQLLNVQLGRMKDAGKLKPVHVSIAKRNNIWMALQCARIARDILGANGITDEYQCMRHMCNLESVYTYEGTHDIHTLIIGEHLTGFGAFK